MLSKMGDHFFFKVCFYLDICRNDNIENPTQAKRSKTEFPQYYHLKPPISFVTH